MFKLIKTSAGKPQQFAKKRTEATYLINSMKSFLIFTLGNCRICLVVTFLVFASTGVPAFADTTQSEYLRSLSDTQRRVHDALRLTPAFARLGVARVNQLDVAEENFRRFGFLQGAKCPAIRMRSAGGLLDSWYRTQVLNTARSTEQLLGRDPSIERYAVAGLQWVLDSLTEDDARYFLSVAESPYANAARSLLAQVAYLETMPGSIDVNTGLPKAAAPIHLKRYFTEEGALDELESTLADVLPDALTDFRRVGAFDQHTMADAPWLTKLSERLKQAAEKIGAAHFARAPQNARDAATLVSFLQPYRRFQAMAAMDMLSQRTTLRDSLGVGFSLPARVDADPAAFAEGAAVISATDLPVEVEERLSKMGPKEFVGDEFSCGN